MEKPIEERNSGSRPVIFVSFLNVLIPMLLSIFLSANFSSVWKLDTSGSLFSNEKEIIGFFLFYPIVVFAIMILLVLFRKKWKKFFQLSFLTQIIQMNILFLIAAFLTS